MDKKDDNYRGMSLRHEKVENVKLPRIKVFYVKEYEEAARKISYGIEEEGLPYEIIVEDDPMQAALEETKCDGLGVSVAVNSRYVGVYSRQLKEEKELLLFENPSESELRTAGQNSARIIKHKPLLWREDK